MGCCNEDNFDPGVDGGAQTFIYTATGMEANPFTVPLPFVRPDTNYNVHITLRRPAANALKVISVRDGTLTTASFDVELSAAAEADDVLMITIHQINS